MAGKEPNPSRVRPEEYDVALVSEALREHRLELLRPSLPDWLPGLRLRNLRVGDALVDVAFAGTDGSVSGEVLRPTGDPDVVVRR